MKTNARRHCADLGAEVVVGDLLDLELIHRAIAGCGTMYFGISGFGCLSLCQGTIMNLKNFRLAAAFASGLFVSSAMAAEDSSLVFQTLTVRKEGAVLFAEIAAPPMNLLGPELVRDLVSLIKQAETDDAFRVLVFKSADPDYFISHVDVNRIKEYREEAAKLTGEASIALLFRHLSANRLVTIAQIESRVRGAGSKFVRLH